MKQKLDRTISKLIDRTSDYLAEHRGAPVLWGIVLVILNFVLRLIPGVQLGFIETSDVLLHLGVIIGLLGALLGEIV